MVRGVSHLAPGQCLATSGCLSPLFVEEGQPRPEDGPGPKALIGGGENGAQALEAWRIFWTLLGVKQRSRWSWGPNMGGGSTSMWLGITRAERHFVSDRLPWSWVLVQRGPCMQPV